MKYKNISARKKRYAIILVALLLLIVAAFIVYRTIIASERNNSGETAPNENSQAANIQQKEDLIDNTQGQETDKSTSNSNDGNQTEQRSVTIELNVNQLNNKKDVIVKTRLYNIPRGQCKLNISNGDIQKTYNAPVIYQDQFSTCAGYTIPVNDIGSGVWSIDLIVSSNDQEFQSDIVRKEVN